MAESSCHSCICPDVCVFPILLVIQSHTSEVSVHASAPVDTWRRVPRRFCGIALLGKIWMDIKSRIPDVCVRISINTIYIFDFNCMFVSCSSISLALALSLPLPLLSGENGAWENLPGNALVGFWVWFPTVCGVCLRDTSRSIPIGIGVSPTWLTFPMATNATFRVFLFLFYF